MEVSKKPLPDKIFLTIDEAAEYLGVHKYLVYKLAKTRGFPAKKFGVQWRIHKEKLERWAWQQVK